MNEAKKPVFKPIVWHVDAYDRQSCERRVSAHPSTAISCVAERVTSKVNTVVSSIRWSAGYGYP